MNEAPGSRVPLTLLTGFLGSGKTTLLNSWLREPALAQAVVVVNEIGEIGIDHHLIARSNDDTIELVNGCLCCTMKGELVQTLVDLLRRRYSGELRPFSHVLIETTGLADPVPVVHAMITMPVVRSYALQQVITAIDGVQGLATLARFPEALRQAAVADEIVVTKADIPEHGRTDILRRLQSINPGARYHHSSPDAAPPIELLLKGSLYDPAARQQTVRDWLRAEQYESAADQPSIVHGHEHEHGHHHHHDGHETAISSFCLRFDAPLQWAHVAAWLESLALLHGNELLRVKGILNIAGQDKPVVVQAVQQLFPRPTQLPHWPDDDRRSQIVFVTQNLSRKQVEDVFRDIQAKTA